MLYRDQYQYTFGQKAMFIALWLLSSLFVVVNFFSNPLFAIDESAKTLSDWVVVGQALLLLTLWFQFTKAHASMTGMLRWLGIGVIGLPYLAQVAFLTYISLAL